MAFVYPQISSGSGSGSGSRQENATFFFNFADNLPSRCQYVVFDAKTGELLVVVAYQPYHTNNNVLCFGRDVVVQAGLPSAPNSNMISLTTDTVKLPGDLAVQVTYNQSTFGTLIETSICMTMIRT
jgi:hypothetical protein